MSFHQFLNSILITFTLLITSLVFFLLFLIILKLYENVLFRRLFFLSWADLEAAYHGLWASLPLGISGIIVGYLTGLSRTPAVSAVIPAVLSLIGAIGILAIGSEKLNIWRVGFAVSIFSLNLYLGTSLGSTVRDNLEAEEFSVNYHIERALNERLIRNARKSLGLPDKPYFSVSPEGKPKE
jgi:hypothetical protein